MGQIQKFFLPNDIRWQQPISDLGLTSNISYFIESLTSHKHVASPDRQRKLYWQLTVLRITASSIFNGVSSIPISPVMIKKYPNSTFNAERAKEGERKKDCLQN